MKLWLSKHDCISPLPVLSSTQQCQNFNPVIGINHIHQNKLTWQIVTIKNFILFYCIFNTILQLTKSMLVVIFGLSLILISILLRSFLSIVICSFESQFFMSFLTFIFSKFQSSTFLVDLKYDRVNFVSWFFMKTIFDQHILVCNTFLIDRSSTKDNVVGFAYCYIKQY